MIKKVFIIPIFFLVSIFFVGYVLFPKYQQVQQFKEEIRIQKDKFADIQTDFLSLEKDVERLKGVEVAVGKINTALPKEISLPDLFSFFQQKSSENGLALNGVSLNTQKGEGEEVENNVKEDYFSLDVSGKYSSLKSFLKTFESSARLVEVESVSIGQGDEAEDMASGILQYNILIKVYSR